MTGDMAAELRTVGAVLFKTVLDTDQVARITALFGNGGRPGKRLSRDDLKLTVDLIDKRGPIGSIAADLLGAGAKPVRALLLDKSETSNWRLGWHQDRTIAVQERIDVPGFGPWSVKAGTMHVQPPYEITARMLTIRVHVDDVDEGNGPLEVVPGSHLLGRLDSDAVETLAGKQRPLMCLAEAGDVWAYSTAIVHASAEQKRPGRRRVLQLDYSEDDLPGGLLWASLN